MKQQDLHYLRRFKRGSCVRVADTGIGIPSRERNKVFDAFYQVDSGSTREYGGTGLGLSIVKRLIDAHSGSVHIEDNSPQGTIFVVRLPSRTGSGNMASIPPASAGANSSS